MPRSSQSWVRLQRVPPEIRILTPGLRFFSTSSVRRPSSASRVAASKPGRPGADDDGLIFHVTSTDSARGHVPQTPAGVGPLLLERPPLGHYRLAIRGLPMQ